MKYFILECYSCEGVWMAKTPLLSTEACPHCGSAKYYVVDEWTKLPGK